MLKKKRKAIYIPKSSVILDLKPILAQRNIVFPSAFLIKIGLPTNAVTKLLKGDAKGVNFNEVTKLCFHLNCTPNDLFSVRSMELNPTHALNKLKVFAEGEVPTIASWLAGKSVEEIEQLMKM